MVQSIVPPADGHPVESERLAHQVQQLEVDAVTLESQSGRPVAIVSPRTLWDKKVAN